MKKGQSMSLDVIIIAAIGLVVLVLLVAIFTGKIGGAKQGIDETEKLGKSNVCMGQNRVCTDSAPSNQYSSVATPASGWIDCSKTCYELQP